MNLLCTGVPPVPSGRRQFLSICELVAGWSLPCSERGSRRCSRCLTGKTDQTENTMKNYMHFTQCGLVKSHRRVKVKVSI